jgi:hypothetical protein
MKQQQSQMQAAQSGKLIEPEIEAVAMRNFEARNVRRDRAWSRDQARIADHPVCILSDRERLEFIEQAKHQFEIRIRRGSPGSRT